MVFVVVFFSSLMVNIDHGILPACSEEVKSKMKIENFGFGALGTLVYAGLTVGSVIGTKVYSNTKYIKYVLTASLSCLGLVLIAFTMSSSFKLSMLLRFITGFFEVFISIYAPVWADAMGSEKVKTIWVSGLLLCSPLGIFVGFTMTSYMVANYRWEYSFIVQACIAVPCVAAILYTPLEYLNIDAAIQHRGECAKKVQKLMGSKSELPKLQK
jgi:MFS family permease